jgi:hypothetical protein
MYYAYFHSVLTCGIIFWGSSIDVKKDFKLKNKAVTIMKGVNFRSLCRPIFKKLEILTVLAK